MSTAIIDHLVGRTVNLKKTGYTRGETTYYSYELDDKLFEDEIDGLVDNVRIMLPGYMYTADWQPGRYNISIDANGLVYEVSKG